MGELFDSFLFGPEILTKQNSATMKLTLALIAAAQANNGERKAERQALRQDRQMRQNKRKNFTPLRYVYQL